MPTLTTTSVDHMGEPTEASRSSPSMEAMTMKKRHNFSTPYPSGPSSRLERCNTAPMRPDDPSSKRPDIPPPHPHLRRRNSSTPDRRSSSPAPRPPISPSTLYATPESTPLPDSPTSPFPPLSPYVINHKRRGPRLVKSLSDRHVIERKVDEVDARFYNAHLRRMAEENNHNQMSRELLRDQERSSDGDASKDEGPDNGSSGDAAGGKGELKILTGQDLQREDNESEDFYDPPEGVSYMSYTDGEDYDGNHSARMYTPMADFYDAWEELSSESGRQSRRSLFNAEMELREMRLSLLMEIEKRKHAEEALNCMRTQWQILREKLSTVGLKLPANFPGLSDDNKTKAVESVDDFCQQLHVTRFVSESIGKAAAKAEVEAEMQAQLEAKNFEIARLSDRLRYYDTMNREMSHRNQEAIEITRRERQKKRMRQEWIWGSIGAAIALGSVALAWSYIPGAKGLSFADSFEACRPENKSK